MLMNCSQNQVRFRTYINSCRKHQILLKYGIISLGRTHGIWCKKTLGLKFKHRSTMVALLYCRPTKPAHSLFCSPIFISHVGQHSNITFLYRLYYKAMLNRSSQAIYIGMSRRIDLSVLTGLALYLVFQTKWWYLIENFAFNMHLSQFLDRQICLTRKAPCSCSQASADWLNIVTILYYLNPFEKTKKLIGVWHSNARHIIPSLV